MLVLVLGGYGGTGKVFCRYLLKETNVNLIVAGRNFDRAKEYAEKLKQDFSSERISASYADASREESLRKAFKNIDFVLVAATVTKWAVNIAEIALETGIDYLDIYFQQDVYPLLEAMSRRISQSGSCFITQAGFHPGLPAAFVRKGSQYFDRYDKAIIAFAMNVEIKESKSVLEVVDSIADYQPEFYKNGKWKTGTYKDAIDIDFGKKFGMRSSMPLDMVEIKQLPEKYGLREIGVFTTGFNWFTDYFLFPLMMLSYKIKKGLLRNFWAKLLVFGIREFSGKQKGVVFLLQAEGEKNGHHLEIKIISEHSNGYDFTVIPVIACLKQYLDGSIRKPGLWMMGHIVEPDKLLRDMEGMGVKFKTLINDRDQK